MLLYSLDYYIVNADYALALEIYLLELIRYGVIDKCYDKIR